MKRSRVVTLSIKAKVPFLRGINNKTVQTNTAITWRELFRNKFDLDINPVEFIVQRVGEFSNKTSSLNAPISDFISAFAKMRKEYRVDVVRSSNKNLKSPAKDKSEAPKSKRGRPRKVQTLPEFFQESQNQSPRKFTSRLERNSSCFSAQEIPPQVSSTSRNRNGLIIEGDDIEDEYINDDDNDNASICTTATADSQELLMDHGITPMDIKSKIVQRLMDNISNSQLLIIQKEITKLKHKRKMWIRYARTAPQTNILVTELFL